MTGGEIYMGLSEKMPMVQEWYDGYLFGNNEIFCPWDVVCYISDALESEDDVPKNFWANTSGNAILDNFINHPKIDVSGKFEILLNGGTITEEISQELTYDQIEDETRASSSLTEILWNSISYYDYSESYYHGMLNGIWTSRGYQTESNEEAGLGRLDLRVKDRSNRRVILMEFKRSAKEEELRIAFFGKKARVRSC